MIEGSKSLLWEIYLSIEGGTTDKIQLVYSSHISNTNKITIFLGNSKIIIRQNENPSAWPRENFKIRKPNFCAEIKCNTATNILLLWFNIVLYTDMLPSNTSIEIGSPLLSQLLFSIAYDNNSKQIANDIILYVLQSIILVKMEWQWTCTNWHAHGILI